MAIVLLPTAQRGPVFAGKDHLLPLPSSLQVIACGGLDGLSLGRSLSQSLTCVPERNNSGSVQTRTTLQRDYCLAFGLTLRVSSS